MIKVYAIGGYNEVGRNMTALQLDEDVIVFDCGFYLPPIVEAEEKEKVYTEKKLRIMGAIPDDFLIEDYGLKEKVRAILISHAHLDHIGAVPYLSNKYKCDIISTPFTLEILKTLLKDNNLYLHNKIRTIHPNTSLIVKGEKDRKVEFINITHSTLQASLIVVHTDKGAVVYANDFKFDNNPIVGKRPNYERLRELGKEGVLALIVESLYGNTEGKTPSEKIARNLLEDVMLTPENKDAVIIVTTFSSHIARLKSIVDFAKQLKRKPVLIGRSLKKYVGAAIKLKLCPFAKDIKLASYKKEVEKVLKEISKNKSKYVLVCTGHQGEPGSILDRLSKHELPFKIDKRDHVIFSSNVIPTPISIANRSQLEKRLKDKGVRIFSGVHVSGHAYREDLRDLITMLKPKHLIPAHGDMNNLSSLAELSKEEDYILGKTVHILQNGQSLALD